MSACKLFLIYQILFLQMAALMTVMKGNVMISSDHC